MIRYDERKLRYDAQWLRLATLNCNHCGKELCFDTRRYIFNKHPEKHYNVIRECKTEVCRCCGETIDFTKANLVIHEPPIEIDAPFAPIN